MLLEDVLSNFPIVTADAVAIGYCPSDDVEWEIVWVNDAFCLMFHADQLDVLGRHPNTIHHPDYLADFVEHVEEMETEGRSYLTIGSRCRCDDGAEFWASISLFIVRDHQGGGRHCVLNIRDINDLKDREQAAELALIENEQLLSRVEAAQTRLITAIETTGDPFAIFDRRDKLVIWNPAYAETLSDDADCLTRGMKFGAVLRVGVENGRFPEAEDDPDAWIEATLSSWKDPSISEHRLSSDGREYKVVVTHAANGDRILLQIDITEFLEQERRLKSYAEQLEHSNQEFSYQALHDELTGLGNRRFLKLKLDELRKSRRKSGGEIAALHLDLDRFKQINDTMGHAVGDFVLGVVSDRLRDVLSSNDVISRTGGDEFVVLMTVEKDARDPVEIAERLVDDMSKPVTFDGRPCDFGASIGVASTPICEPENLLTSSDIALYKAKDAGRGCVGVFDEKDLEELLASDDLGDEIARGLENNEFVPAFLPIVHTRTGEVLGYEVLARWQHPTRGELLPAQFLEAADDIQVTDQIDKAVFTATMEACRKSFGNCDICPDLSFNICHARSMDADLASEISLWDYPGAISFEMDESILLEDESLGFTRSLNELRSAGVRIVVDNFGSGQASLVSLRRLAPSEIKVDPRLIEPIADKVPARQMVKSIVETGRALGIAVTAEGVETDGQAKALSEMECDRAQGFFFARPMSLKEFLDEIQPPRHEARA